MKKGEAMKRECNNCATSYCPAWRNIVEWNRHYDCAQWVAPAPLQTPMLYHLLAGGSGQAVLGLLEQAEIRLEEKQSYPFFTLKH
jgi:hypothetical protein